MDRCYQEGVAQGLRRAAELCDETAGQLDLAAQECERDGDSETAQLTGVAAVCMRHASARIRAAEVAEGGWSDLAASQNRIVSG